MAVVITMKDVLVSEVVDEDYDDVMQTLRQTMGQGVGFLVLNDVQGDRISFNIANIMTVKELSES